MLELADETDGTLTEDKYLLAREENLHKTRTLGLDKTLNDWNLDGIMTTEILSLPAVAGYPSITVPAGINFDVPEKPNLYGETIFRGYIVIICLYL